MDLNHLNAKLIKAEIMGNTEMVNLYKKQIEEFQSKKETEKKSLENLNEYNDKLNHLNAKLIKAEILNNQKMVDEYKNKIEELKSQFSDQNKTFVEKVSKEQIIEKQNNPKININQQSDFRIDKESNKDPENNVVMSLRDQKKELLNNLKKKRKEQEAKLESLKNSLIREEMDVNLDKCKVLKRELKELNAVHLADKKKIKDLEEELEIKKEKMYFDPEKRVNPAYKLPDFEKEESSKKNYKTIQVLRKFNEDNMSLKQMFVSEKNSSSTHDNKRYFQASLKIKSEDDEYNDVKCKKVKKEKEFVYQEIDDEETCKLCLNKTKKHLLIDYNDKVMLVMPENQSLLERQLIIRSTTHCSSLVSANEDILDAVEIYKSKMSSLFEISDYKVIFVECFFKNKNKWKRHFDLNCYPIKSKYFEQSKMYFKKSIMDSEEEWSMNKKLVILDGKPVNKMVPKGLPYFCVTFGPKNDGFAHVIENEHRFSKFFAEEVIGGMLNIEPFHWLNPKHFDYEKQKERQSDSKCFWKKFDVSTK